MVQTDEEIKEMIDTAGSEFGLTDEEMRVLAHDISLRRKMFSEHEKVDKYIQVMAKKIVHKSKENNQGLLTDEMLQILHQQKSKYDVALKSKLNVAQKHHDMRIKTIEARGIASIYRSANRRMKIRPNGFVTSKQIKTTVKKYCNDCDKITTWKGYDVDINPDSFYLCTICGMDERKK